MSWSYHLLDYDWTPLSRNPCWLSNAFHCLRDYVKRNRPSLISSADTFAKESFSNHKLHCAGDKSIADDFGASRYCKCESSLCATIHWGFSCVPTICSSLKLLLLSSDQAIIGLNRKGHSSENATSFPICFRSVPAIKNVRKANSSENAFGKKITPISKSTEKAILAKTRGKTRDESARF